MPDLDRPIEEYALIGDCATAALLNADGGIDWMCLPSFDGPAVFGALLDREKGGDFVVQPTVPYRTERRYLEDSAIFETRFFTAEATVKLTDFFVIARRHGVHGYDFTTLHPTRKLVRLVELESGSAVPMHLAVRARPNYGREHARWTPLTSGFTCGPATVFSNTGMTCQEQDLAASWSAEAGQTYFVELDYGDERPIPTIEDIRRWHRVTVKFWQHWSYFNNYRGLHQEVVRRSAVTLKLLTHAATGAFVAAPTTSLPEIAGGEANWDYRFTWVRDTSFFLNTLFRVGYSGEAMSFLNFVVKESMKRDGQGELVPVLYGVRSESVIEEEELEHLRGYRNSRPVRIGNRAAKQFQIDNFAHILETLAFYKHTGGTINGDKMKLVRQMAEETLRRWREPDNGLWEEEKAQEFTYGKVSAWAGLMSAAQLTDLQDLPIEKTCDDIRTEVLARAVRTEGEEQHMVSRLDSNDLDAACLLTFLNGFSAPALARGTRQRIERELADGPFLYRNPEQKKKGEGAFFLCMFWRINHLVKEGEQARAEELLEQALAMLSPFGLLSEEIDPKSRRFLGNFPQAFSHLGLINAILNVDEAQRNPEMAGLADQEKFMKNVGLTVGLRAVIIGFFRVPKTLLLFFRSGGSKWRD